MNRPTVLYSAACDGITLGQALEHAPTDGIGLFATPWRYHVVRLDGVLPRTRAGVVETNDVFEARVFTEEAELRWTDTGGGRGRAVLLTEDASALPEAFPEHLDRIEAFDVLRGEYLLWGRATREQQGWTVLTAARIGTLEIPARIPGGGRALLVTREYVAVEHEHGNASVVEERLLGLEAVPNDKEGAAA